MEELRPYQQQAFDTLTRLARTKQFLLLQAATGAGKTVIAAHLMQYYSGRWGFRCLFLAHKAILVRQALQRMRTTFEDADFDVDCLCASVSRPGVARSRIIVASPQTLARRLDDLPPVDMVIIDECHRVPPKGQNSLYADVIGAVTTKRPGARVVGITATPWRLGMPWIYGPATREGMDTWWDGLDVRISITELQEQGFLSPLVAKACVPEEDLLDVPVGASGDFREDALEEVLLKPLHLGSAVKALRTHADDRKHIAVFCVTIAHARALADRLNRSGVTALAIDSRSGQDENLRALDAFQKGEVRALCSVGMLTEGWDAPATDCLLMCRPTLSPALYVQMVGRGLRIAPGKKDCLLLDLSGNIDRHGAPNAPRVLPRSADLLEYGPSGRSKKEGESERHCPFCAELLPQETGLRCPRCNAPFYEFEEKDRSFREVDLARLERWTRRGEEIRRARAEEERRKKAELRADEEARAKERARIRASTVNGGRPVAAHVLNVANPVPHRVKSGPCAGVTVLRSDILLEIPGSGRRVLSQLLDPERAMGRRSRTFFWVYNETRSFWTVAGQGPCPSSMAGMVARWGSVRVPQWVVVRESANRWLRALWNADPADPEGLAAKEAKKAGKAKKESGKEEA